MKKTDLFYALPGILFIFLPKQSIDYIHINKNVMPWPSGLSPTHFSNHKHVMFVSVCKCNVCKCV